LHRNDFFETGGAQEICLDVNSRPGDGIGIMRKDRFPYRPEQGVLRLLHVLKKGRKVGDPSGIRLAEFDSTFPDKWSHLTSETHFGPVNEKSSAREPNGHFLPSNSFRKGEKKLLRIV
jgi:hypothetical protein